MVNKKKVIIISELFSPPYDEGMKNVNLSLLKAMNKETNCIGIGPISNSDSIDIIQLPFKKYLFSFRLAYILKEAAPDLLLYIPEASATLFSFIRYRILGLMSMESKLGLIVLQNREYSWWSKKIISLLKPKNIFSLSSSMKKRYSEMNISSDIFKVGIDTDKFYPVDSEKKKEIRKKYNIPQEDYLFIHVGHIRADRNIEFLLEIASKIKGRILIVGSTSTPQENLLKERVKKTGIFIIDYYVAANEELYQMADCYIFPVKKSTAAIEFPLSILEAMSCNLPILTTPFGSLPEYFKETESFKYIEGIDDFLQKSAEVKKHISTNRQAALSFSWDNVAKELLKKCLTED